MRNVMVRCIFSALSVGLFIVGVLGQEIHRYQWTDQQVLADEWKPFVPGFIPQRQFETYPARPDSSRQFFGKTPEPLQQNPYKKSFQTAASANNIEPYAVPPILGSFNTFGLQTIQARNPSLEKNIKDNQFLEQGSHLHPKFYPQNSQQPQRFPQPAPTFVQPQHPQYLPNQHHQQHYGNQFRLENPSKPQTLIQSPTRTIQSSVQVFPPNPPNHYQQNYHQNAYFLGVPQSEEDESVLGKQNSPRPNSDFLLNGNNVATIYGSRDPALNIPPPALKPTPFIRNEQIQQDHFVYDNNLKSIHRYEGANTYNKRPYEAQQVKHIDTKKPQDDNPSKQVYEQLSHFGRPFSLPKESIPEFTRPKPDLNSELDSNQAYNAPVEQYKKEKVKPSQLHGEHKILYGHSQVNNAYPLVSTTPNVVLDYEPAKLQNVKTVTYVPQRNVLQFNEQDVSGGLKQYQNNENYNSYTRPPFLPTPTEAQDELSGFGDQQRFTTPAQKITPSLPKNHKYGSIQHTGTRNRYQPNYQNQEPVRYQTTSTTTESKPIASYDENIKYTVPTQTPEYANEQQYETTTKKTGGRRRKPSKTNKTKEQTRYKFPTFAEATATSTANVNNYYVSNDISTTETTIQHTTAKKKQTKYTTAKPDEDYPNYPQYVKQQENYPKEYFQNTQPHNMYDNQETAVDYFNSEKEEKENYPQTLVPSSTTTTTTPESTTSSLKARIKNKFTNSTRPRFSIKDYKRTSVSTQSTPTSTTEAVEEAADTEKKNVRKFAFASRSKNKTETTKTPEESTSESIRKYKPRARPSKFRVSSTTPAPVVTDSTSERVNTFKPSTSNRYKSSTSKYYNRFRTTTEITTNDADEPSVASSDKKPVRTMLFSAKRSTLLRSKSTTPKFDEIEDDEEEIIEEDDLPSSPTLKKTVNTQYKSNTKLDKADDASQTSIMTSSEEQNEKTDAKEVNKDTKPSSDTTASSEEEIDDFSDILDLKENEVSTSSSLPAATAEDRMDDADKVSKVSSLTSIDESDIPISFFQKWSSNDNQNQ